MRIAEEIIGVMSKIVDKVNYLEKVIVDTMIILKDGNFENRIKALEEQQRQQKMAIEALHKGFKKIVGIEEEGEDKNEQKEI